MKKYIAFIVGVLHIFVMGSCSDDVNSPMEKDKSAPEPVYNVTVENLSGAALIHYSLPTNEDLLYVLASYTNKKGQVVNARSSYYTNSIRVEGFGDTDEYTIQLYAVDRSENKSVAVETKIKPLTPQVILTAGQLEINPDFGGINIVINNEARADLAIMVSTANEDGEMTTAETFYTALNTAKFFVRGYESEPRKFAVVVRDKWENLSDTVYAEVTPIYEIMLDKTKFKALILPGDAPATNWGGSLEYMWDGVNDGEAAHTGNIASGEPKYVSFDMGVTAQLSRFNLQPTADDKHMFNDVSPRLYEIWGCETFDPSGSFDGWTKLVTIENIKPSGLPVGLLTEDDRRVARQGDDADIPSDMPKVRYIRIRCLNNWSGNTNMVISEVTLWGNDK
ncbi:DUF4959 domain-containing protein [Bacteroides sp. 51]|uniref:DUF5000 domain-containing lipoprotein n=1 Tax=Bacteroides sp. 51 TaxID=2302938 RepID=UPI001EF33876|nr:DUF4959 domain-containing protein [Bacteroides sp. 51]